VRIDQGRTHTSGIESRIGVATRCAQRCDGFIAVGSAAHGPAEAVCCRVQSRRQARNPT